jgi:methylase of polypeptide subunit release factors
VLERLGQLLRDAGYTGARFGLDAGNLLTPNAAPVHARRLGADLAADLARLFMFEMTLPRSAAATAVGSLDVDDLASAGVLEVDGDSVRAGVRITPYHDLLLMHDLDRKPWPADHVLAPGPTARALDHFTVRRPVQRALDIGTGCGIQALRAAQHAERVVATDITQRCLDFAAMSAQLNGIDNVEFRLGDLFEPVAGDRFDLIVCNPPFVISPRNDFAYRDGGLEGDGLTQAVVRGLPAHLVDGGVAHVLCNWFFDDETVPTDRPMSWLAGASCDVLVLHYEAEDLLTYAARWTEELASDPDAYGLALDEWTAYLAGYGQRIATGAITVARRAGASATRGLRLSVQPGPNAGPQLGRMVDDLSDDAPITAADVLAVVDGVVLEQRLVADGGAFTVGAAQFAIPDAAGISVLVPPLALHVVLQLDGHRTIAEIAAEAAEEMGIGLAELEVAAIDAAEGLLAAGLLFRIERA